MTLNSILTICRSPTLILNYVLQYPVYIVDEILYGWNTVQYCLNDVKVPQIYISMYLYNVLEKWKLRFTLDSHALMQWRWNKWLQGRCELVSMTTKEAKHIEQGARSSALNYKIYVITNLIKYIIIISILYSIIIIILYFWYNMNKHINKFWSID